MDRHHWRSPTGCLLMLVAGMAIVEAVLGADSLRGQRTWRYPLAKELGYDTRSWGASEHGPKPGPLSLLGKIVCLAARGFLQSPRRTLEQQQQQDPLQQKQQQPDYLDCGSPADCASVARMRRALRHAGADGLLSLCGHVTRQREDEQKEEQQQQQQQEEQEQKQEARRRAIRQDNARSMQSPDVASGIAKRYKLSFYDCISLYCGELGGNSRSSCILNSCHREKK